MNSKFTRRDFGKMAFAGIPVASAMLLNSDLFAADKPNSKFKGVQIGVITYSFNGMAAAEIIPSMVAIGLSAVELMSNHAESLAGAPAAGGFGGGGRGPAGPQTLGTDGLLPRCESMQMVPTPAAEGAAGGAGRGRGPLTPEQQSAQQKLKDWRAAATPETWKGVRKQFDDAGIALPILCYNMAANISDDDIDYAFRMARDLGVEAISSTSTVPVAKRVAPFADKYKIKWGGHGHDDIHDAIQFSTPDRSTR